MCEQVTGDREGKDPKEEVIREYLRNHSVGEVRYQEVQRGSRMGWGRSMEGGPR